MTEWGIDTLFNPGKRHMDEEKRRLQSTREEVGDSSGGRRIDLDSGKMVISRKKPNPAESAGESAAESAAHSTAESAADTAVDVAAERDAQARREADQPES